MPEIMEWFKQGGIEQGMERGIEQGLRLKALEDARMMLEHGIAWSIIADVTGIRSEDLEAN